MKTAGYVTKGLLLAVSAVLLAGCAPRGCGQTDRTSGLGAADLPPPTFGEAVVRGAVRFEGEPPEMQRIDAATPCGAEIHEEWAVVSPDGGLANVLVYLEGADPSTGLGSDSALLDQIDCRFVPHVMAVQVGQEIEMRSRDAVRHNVHYRPSRNPHRNLSLENAAQVRHESFVYPEPRPMRVRCDVHPWMSAFIAVFDHPFFAVTDESGRFEIASVPAGQYTLRAWHERFGERHQPVVVPEASELDLEFVYARPGS